MKPVGVYHYPAGTVRYARWRGDGDIRAYCPPEGWSVEAVLTDTHPLTHAQLERSEWWVIETKECSGDETC